MAEKKTSVFENGLIWFGAAVSIAEIMTGTLLTSLGMMKGVAAILLGHFIGCVLFYFAGLIGAETSKSAMETVKLSFGQKGSLLFSVLNILQLVGWTAIMIFVGSESARLIWPIAGNLLWCAVIAVLILVWILIGVKNLSRLNILALGGLLILCAVLTAVVFRGISPLSNASSSIGGTTATGGLTFGQAVELSAAMPLSWLPLVSDYTRHAARKKAASFTSAAVYFLTSSWMYTIGLGAAFLSGDGDTAKIMLSAGLGAAGLLIVILSTVTTAFLDVYSAGVSAVSAIGKLDEKRTAVAVCVLGFVLAAAVPVTRFESFLYLIGSVFTPMFSILIVDYFLLKNDASNSAVNIRNLVIWAVGFAVYRLSMSLDTPVGNSLPVMIITGLLCFIANKIGGRKKC